MSEAESLQAPFLPDDAAMAMFIASISPARFARYETACNGDKRKAIDLYFVNAKLSQSLYLNIQTWEIALRNKLSGFLRWKYGPDWPFDPIKLERNLTANDRRRLSDAVERQRQSRGAGKVSADVIIADLSAGFWVSLLTKSYEVPFVWRHNLRRVFPHAQTWDRASISATSGALLDLRNRIAHHEPIYHLPLSDRHDALRMQIAHMCPASAAYASHACTFAMPWHSRNGLMIVTPIAANSTIETLSKDPPLSPAQAHSAS